MTSSDTNTTTDERVTLDDLRSKFRELGSGVDRGVESARQGAMIAAAIGVTVLVVAAYWFGRRRGSKKQTIVEIRRV